MPKILVLFGHPAFEQSRVHKALCESAMAVEGVQFHDLYEAYPDFDIDVPYEKQLLLEHDIIVLQHPVFWYSAPPIFKQWIDLVLEYGWAYGKNGTALTGKSVLQVISTGGQQQAYMKEGRNRFMIREFLSPFDQTFHLCHMNYLAPFIVHGTHRLSIPDIERAALHYQALLQSLQDGSLAPADLLKIPLVDALYPVVDLKMESHG